VEVKVQLTEIGSCPLRLVSSNLLEATAHPYTVEPTMSKSLGRTLVAIACAALLHGMYSISHRDLKF